VLRRKLTVSVARDLLEWNERLPGRYVEAAPWVFLLATVTWSAALVGAGALMAGAGSLLSGYAALYVARRKAVEEEREKKVTKEGPVAENA
jgi:hypothetical protein